MAKVEVDHSELSGAPPKTGANEGNFLDAMSGALKGAGVAVAEPTPPPAPQVPAGILGTIQRGKKLMPPRIIIYGLDGLGKSSFAAQAPNPIFIDTEDRLREVDCSKFEPAKSYGTVLTQLKAIANEKHGYETIVIDTLDWLERLIWENVCRRDSKGADHIEKVGGGFAKGYKLAIDEWMEIKDLLSWCNVERGMVVIMTAHANIERFEDPVNGSYDRYEPRLHYLAQDMLREWVDATFFLTTRLIVKKEGTGFNERGLAQPVGADGGERILKTVGSPAWIAKNSYNLPSELPFPRGKAWDLFVDAMMKGREI